MTLRELINSVDSELTLCQPFGFSIKRTSRLNFEAH